MVLLPISRRFQVFIHIKNTASPGFFFIEREESNKRTLIKVINFPGSQGALINFIAETTGKSDSQSFFISYREKNDPESKYTRWEMDRCIFTELT